MASGLGRVQIRAMVRPALLLGGLALFPALLAAQLPRSSPETVGMSAQRLARIPVAMHRFVDQGEVAGVVTLVARKGRLVAVDTAGYQDLQARRVMRSGSIFRIASMTKPITSVAAMILVEEGKLRLEDPLSRYLPAFEHMNVSVPVADSSGSTRSSLRPATHPITVHDLLTHRSGLVYGFIDTSAVGRAYRKAGISDGLGAQGATMAENVEKIARQPLAFEPGSRWRYSLATDVLGRLIEVVSGQSLDRFLKARIFGPLRMKDTYFYVPDGKLDRLAAPYTHDHGRLRVIADSERFLDGRLLLGGKTSRGSTTYFSGGAGLASTAGDYARFLQMLLNGGELDGVRILSPKTVELMTASATNDLGPIDPGVGFGLGFGVVTDLGAAGKLGSVGQYSWGGIYGSSFWVDPRERVIGVMMIQLFPQRAPVAGVFQTLAYQAIVSTADGRPGP
jgi:CubicO group peptidase (beta-lactamase class C family)